MKIFKQVVLFVLLAAVSTVRAEVQIKNPRLTLSADMAQNRLTVEDSKTKRVWRAQFNRCAGSSSFDDWQHIQNPEYGAFTLCKAEQTSVSTMKLTVKDEQSGRIYFLDAELKADSLVFELSSEDMEAPMTCVGLPPVFTTKLDDGHLIFCDRSSGVLNKQTDFEGYADRVLSTYANTSCLDMPWVGVVDLKRGDGMLVLFETPLDSAMHLRTIAGELWPQPLWKGRLNTLNYRRRVSYRFSATGGYVALAGFYREYQQEQGKLKTLAEKMAERPNVARLAGSAPIWADSDVFEFIHDARNRGVVRALLANPERHGHGREETQQLNKMGYLTLRYDSYSDILEGDPWFQCDDIQKTAYVLQPGGEPLKGWKTLEGLQFYSRSSAFALRAAKAYSGELMEGQGLNANFIDVLCAMDLMEDYHPEHTFGRGKDMQFKREVLKYYTDKSFVLGTEHGNDWCVDRVDYTEGALSGAFWWVPGKNKTGWNPGHLQRPVSRDDFSALYLKYGVSPVNRIPLWQLVYHDCLASTWYWGDSPGWFYEIAPEISDLKDVQTVLYGAMPLFWRDSHRGYDWSQNKDRWMESYYLTVKFHEAVFGEQMLSHTFVTDDRMVQKTEFKNGAVAWVNFGSKNYRVKLGGKELTLPPNGFHAQAPGVEQGRMVQNNTVMTFVKTKDFFYYKSTAKNPTEPLSIAGEIVLFRLDESRWNVLFKPEATEGSMDMETVGKFIGWDRFKIHPLSDDWKIKEALLPSGDAGNTPLPRGAYALIKQPEAEREVMQ